MKSLYHPNGATGIKNDVLMAVGEKNYGHKVGGNPDLKVIGGKIHLIGVGPFKGKSYPTNLNSKDYSPPN